MAKMVAQSSVADRLREYVRLEDRFNKLNSARRWSAAAMKREALKHYSEARLRQLAKEIDTAADPGRIRDVVRYLQGPERLASSLYSGYVPPSRSAHLLVPRPGLRDAAEHDMRRFKTDIAEVYGLAVLEAAEDPKLADIFGPCDDPERAAAEMADIKVKLDTLKESLRAQFAGDDVGYSDAVTVGGRRMSAAFYKITSGEVELGAGPEGLIPWARAHRAELGV